MKYQVELKRTFKIEANSQLEAENKSLNKIRDEILLLNGNIKAILTVTIKKLPNKKKHIL